MRPFYLNRASGQLIGAQHRSWRMKFVHLNRTNNEGSVWVNLSQILLMFPDANSNGTRIVLGSSETIYVRESPAEVKEYAE